MPLGRRTALRKRLFSRRRPGLVTHLQRAALDLPTRGGLQHPLREGSASQSSLRLVLPCPGFSPRQLHCRRSLQLVRRRPELGPASPVGARTDAKLRAPTQPRPRSRGEAMHELEVGCCAVPATPPRRPSSVPPLPFRRVCILRFRHRHRPPPVPVVGGIAVCVLSLSLSSFVLVREEYVHTAYHPITNKLPTCTMIHPMYTIPYSY